MIYYSVPYDQNKNIGAYYNKFMELLPNNDDYACFVDGDTIFTTSDYGSHIQKIVESYPNVGCFTCYTNRVNCKWQIAPNVNIDNNDISYHREFGRGLQALNGINCEDVTYVDRGKVMSGVLILLKKSTWKKIGGFKEQGMLGIDNDLHWKIQDKKQKLYLMKGVYVYHWYRWPNYNKKDHLI